MVTHRQVTGCFMTVPEACALGLQTRAVGRPGQVLVLDMGEPIKILGMARRLIEESGRTVSIKYTGLRAGEKLHTVLLSDTENGVASDHSLIRRVQVPPLACGEVLLDPSEPQEVGALMRYQSNRTSIRTEPRPAPGVSPEVAVK